jgi:PhnB protein
MTVTSTLHLNFRGRAREALEFYHSVFGGDIVLVPYGDADLGQGPEQAAQIVWGQVESPVGFRVMAFDVRDSQAHDPGTIPFFFALRGTDADEVGGYWDALAASEGVTIDEPFGPAVFSPMYGKLTDRFGVTWIIDVMVPWSGA